ncbi:Uncharacterized protein APZ42_003812 [Daphnia magna]|uniref:Uncharacterized protein n=1 Tax=Daphnia magna TaxID=35525 RepID=A0A164HET7_9CRUS|nr:Uncharacterized protein APZ42_003812 [Daphnia magna]
MKIYEVCLGTEELKYVGGLSNYRFLNAVFSVLQVFKCVLCRSSLRIPHSSSHNFDFSGV